MVNPKATAFSEGDDFISFDKSPPPKPAPLPPPIASSSKLPDKSSQKNGSKGKGKKRGREEETGPSNLKQERMAAERGCPWVPQVDWESCRDPAEMCVIMTLLQCRRSLTTRNEVYLRFH
jgi:hypothetical protein